MVLMLVHHALDVSLRAGNLCCHPCTWQGLQALPQPLEEIILGLAAAGRCLKALVHDAAPGGIRQGLPSGSVMELMRAAFFASMPSLLSFPLRRPSSTIVWEHLGRIS